MVGWKAFQGPRINLEEGCDSVKVWTVKVKCGMSQKAPTGGGSGEWGTGDVGSSSGHLDFSECFRNWSISCNAICDEIFVNEIWSSNCLFREITLKNGKVCISLLHVIMSVCASYKSSSGMNCELFFKSKANCTTPFSSLPSSASHSQPWFQISEHLTVAGDDSRSSFSDNVNL